VRARWLCLTLEGRLYFTSWVALKPLNNNLAQECFVWYESESEGAVVNHLKRDLTVKTGVDSWCSQMNRQTNT